MDGNGTERARFAAELARRRAEAGLSLADVATTAHVARGYVHHVEHARRWPSLTVARALDAAVAAEGALLILWRAGDAARRAAHTGRAVATTSHSQPPEDPHGALVSAADESAHFLAWAEASNTGDLTVEQMHADVRRIAACYLQVPTLPLFARARATRDRAFTLLAGRQRPRQTRELYAAAGWALTLLAWMSTDLGRPDAAGMHARAAWMCAENADHNGLRAWVRATQHTAAFWEDRFLDAARYAEDGLRYATGTASTLLASAHAIDLGKAGYVEEAQAALARARAAAESVEQISDELTGPFTCSVDRARGFWSDLRLTLGQPAEALTEADAAVTASERAPVGRRNHGSERMARLQQVRAHVALRQYDGAAEALAPVLRDTAPEHRVQPLLQRLGEVLSQSSTVRHRGEPTLSTMHEEIIDFRRQAVVADAPI